MVNFSKLIAGDVFVPLFNAATSTATRKAISLLILGLIAYGIRKRSQRFDRSVKEEAIENKSERKK